MDKQKNKTPSDDKSDQTIANYWQDKLGRLESSRLPADFPHEKAGQGPCHTRSIHFPDTQIAEHETFALSACFCLLHYLTRSDAIGLEFTDDRSPGRALPLLVEFDDETSLGELPEKTSQELRESRGHEDAPPPLEFLEASFHFGRGAGGGHAVAFQVRKEASGLVFSLHCRSLAYEEATVERWIGYLEKILREMEADPAKKLSELDLLGEGERRTLMEEFNRTDFAFPREQTIVSLFEERARETPDKVAAVHRGETLTFRQLNGRANQLARRLRDKGVRPNDIVAIMAERSHEMMVGVLGVLKAGGAYLPLDSDYPEKRLRFMLDAADVKILALDRKGLEAADSHGLPQETLHLWTFDGASDAQNMEIVNQGDDLAYVIFTSGTTGEPKGVMIEHHSIVNLAHYIQQTLTQEEVLEAAQLAPFTFDASAGEIFNALLAGCTVHIIDPETVNDPETLIEYYNRHRITFSYFPPPTWRT